MPSCPITLDSIPADERFSVAGLRMLHPRLTDLAPLNLSLEDQLKEARLRADKMSIQGVQPKLSAILKIKGGRFEIVDRGGRWILKPNPSPYQEVPANEALTMSMAAAAGIEVPDHGLLPAIDGNPVYFIRRVDRIGRSEKIHVEDFAQLSGATRDTKYDGSLEQVANIIKLHCTFPAIEKAKLAKRLLFCFLTGNEDMHLKNFSLQSINHTVSLTPAYDLLNTTLVLENAIEESALHLKGKKNNLTRKLWIDYFCRERLSLPDSIIKKILTDFATATPTWHRQLKASFLSPARQQAYRHLLTHRLAILVPNS